MYSPPTPDATQMGCAMAGGADAFVTNDAALAKIKEIAVLVRALGLVRLSIFLVINIKNVIFGQKWELTSCSICATITN